ncbi:MAG TPA: hypothetical protein DDW27_15020 [Bacteroidales bacterium]|nr:hypothetical protein [Bacteroidales bacterium]
MTFTVLSQAPQRLSYQAVIRSLSGELVTGKSVGMQISILQGSESGTAVFVERHTTTTNANGLATVQIGGGTVISGSFNAIDWNIGPYFLKTETDPGGGTSYSITGTSQLLSVPYSLFAKNSNEAEKLKLPFSATIAHSDYAFKITNTASSAINVASTATTGIRYAINAETRSVDDGTAAVRASSGTLGSAGTTFGVLAISRSTSGRGVVGIANSLTGQTYGVYGESYSSEGFGIYGYAGSETGNTTAVFGATRSPSGTAIYGICYPATGTGHGVSGHVNSPDAYSGFFTGGRFYVAGNTGIGTTNPSAKLEVAGQVKITGGSPAAGKVLTSDAGGLASWEPLPQPVVNRVYFEVKRDVSYQWPTNATVQKVNFSSGSTEWKNEGKAFDATTSTFTAPENGLYSFTGCIRFTDLALESLIYAYISAGGKNYYGTSMYSSGKSEHVIISITLYLSAGQTAQLWGYVNNSAPPTNVYGNSVDNFAFTYFSGAKIN